MKLFVNSTPETFSNGMLGYVVLSAKSAPKLPFLSDTHTVSRHIVGSVNGSTVVEASAHNQIFYPAKRVVFNAFSSMGYDTDVDLEPVVSALSNLRMDQEGDVSLSDTLRDAVYPAIKPVSTLFLERSDPFGLSMIVSKESPLSMYGIYNQTSELLVVTNIDNYDSLLEHRSPTSWWVYRFAPRDSMFCVLQTRRLCNRWYRWSLSSNTASAYNRFAALERMLFKNTLVNYDVDHEPSQ